MFALPIYYLGDAGSFFGRGVGLVDAIMFLRGKDFFVIEIY